MPCPCGKTGKIADVKIAVGMTFVNFGESRAAWM